ncbi:unnamed protein product [Prorocentrum cordatum]|uniref:Uncharacterized protein n=1 Tax=Prorocentrum cordatum TaxID=2364126 RepID=A0ABN9UNA0_9DINO|nr:unnamed protein product [Polarella glacialis]
MRPPGRLCRSAPPAARLAPPGSAGAAAPGPSREDASSDSGSEPGSGDGARAAAQPQEPARAQGPDPWPTARRKLRAAVRAIAVAPRFNLDPASRRSYELDRAVDAKAVAQIDLDVPRTAGSRVLLQACVGRIRSLLLRSLAEDRLTPSSATARVSTLSRRCLWSHLEAKTRRTPGCRDCCGAPEASGCPGCPCSTRGWGCSRPACRTGPCLVPPPQRPWRRVHDVLAPGAHDHHGHVAATGDAGEVHLRGRGGRFEG